MMGDAVDDALGDAGEEEETEEVVQQVLLEIGISTDAQVRRAQAGGRKGGRERGVGSERRGQTVQKSAGSLPANNLCEPWPTVHRPIVSRKTSKFPALPVSHHVVTLCGPVPAQMLSVPGGRVGAQAQAAPSQPVAMAAAADGGGGGDAGGAGNIDDDLQARLNNLRKT